MEKKVKEERMSPELLPVREAASWASDYTGKDITQSNISYLVQYAKIKNMPIPRILYSSIFLN
jgi:hypothetical protein